MAICSLKHEYESITRKDEENKRLSVPRSIKYLNIIRLSGRLHACPDLYDTQEEAEKALAATLGKYRTPHLKFVTEPIKVMLEQFD